MHKSGAGFTTGKVYLAKPEMDGAETVGLDWFEVETDDGVSVRFKPEDALFEFLEEVYAVVLNQEVCGVVPGEVVVVDGASPDGLLSVKGEGLYLPDNFILLDRTNIFPGLVIMDSSTGQLKSVSRVDECLWVMMDGGDIYRSPEEFHFAVSGDDILTEPVVRCVMDDGEPELTEGKFYRLLWTRDQDTVTLCDNSGQLRDFMAERFITG